MTLIGYDTGLNYTLAQFYKKMHKHHHLSITTRLYIIVILISDILFMIFIWSYLVLISQFDMVHGVCILHDPINVM